MFSFDDEEEIIRYWRKFMKINPKKSLGQNFLINPHIIDKIIAAAEISKDDLIIEIGPGTGNLTKKLAEKAGRVVAIEKDHRNEMDSERITICKNFHELLADRYGWTKINAKQKIENVQADIIEQIKALL